jgi:hypothetical protein
VAWPKGQRLHLTEGEVEMAVDQQAIVRRLVARELSEKQKEYRDFFMDKMVKYGVDSPAEMDEETKKKFFNEISADWDSNA